jgi:hypothetical protein
MKANLDCIVCHQRQALRVAQLVSEDTTVHEQILRQVMAHLSEADWNTDPMTVTTRMYEVINSITGNPDPYKELKYQSNEEVLQFYHELQDYIRTSSDPLYTACKLSVAGNIMDFGAKEHFNIQETVQDVLKTDFAVNDYDRLKATLDTASSLLLFADNAGEIVFDKLLLETILQYRSLSKITVVVKPFPIINDVTMDDVKQIGLAELPNIEFRMVNTKANGNGNGNGKSCWNPPEVREWIQEHDIVLSKGQANFEIMNEIPGLFFLLMSKCDIVAELIGGGAYNGAFLCKYSS